VFISFVLSQTLCYSSFSTLNHVHILARFPASVSVSEMMRRIKGSSSKWVNERSKSTSHFTWQRGYGAFSASESSIENVTSYIVSILEFISLMILVVYACCLVVKILANWE